MNKKRFNRVSKRVSGALIAIDKEVCREIGRIPDEVAKAAKYQREFVFRKAMIDMKKKRPK